MANNYDGNSISVLEGLEPVRKRPGMYIGSVGTKGLNHLIYEIVDNSVDEHLAGQCSEITVTLEKDGSATIKDNGRGIPVDINEQTGRPAVEVVFTTLHAGGKFGDGNYKISGGLHGVGSSVVNALSLWLEVNVKRDGKVYNQRYEQGKICYDLKETGTCRKNDTGTTVNFFPDGEIFEKIYFKAESIKSRLHETAYLNPELSIIFENKRVGEEETVTFHEPDGIKAFIADMNKDKEKVTDIVYFKNDIDGIEIEVAFQYINEFTENISGFCNNIYTQEGGTHITGFKSILTQTINQYARELGTLKEKDANFTGADVRNGLVAVVACKHPDPRFEGQTKTKLDNPDAEKVTKNIAGEQLTLYFDKNLETLKNVISCAEKSAKIRKSEEKAKTNMLSKSKFSIDSNGKLANCESRKAEDCEIFIVEGDSAGGGCKENRDSMYQAVLPLRGKILNARKTTLARMLNNPEIATLILALGTGISSKYDESKLRYNKVIITTDADVDGTHIALLLITFFWTYMPDLIRNGHVYILESPLYVNVLKNRKGTHYTYSEEEQLEWIKKNRRSIADVQRNKGLGELEKEQVIETILTPETRRLSRLVVEDEEKFETILDRMMGRDVSARRQIFMPNER